MAGMEQSNDGHPWVRYSTTTIVGFKGDVRVSICGGAFICENVECGYFKLHGLQNMIHWAGRLSKPCAMGKLGKQHGGFRCFHCNEKPSRVGDCLAKIYYVMPSDIRYTRLVIHLGKHTHDVSVGKSASTTKLVKGLVQNYVERTPGVGQKRVEKDVAQEIIMKSIIEEDGPALCMLDSDSLTTLLSHLEPLTNQRRLRKWIEESKYVLNPIDEPIDYILKLKEKCKYEFFHASLFPGQLMDTSIERCFIFKMSTTGPASGVDLVKRMQEGGDLQKSWICFDHVRRVRGWSTMGAHVYDPSVQSLQTIAICEMKVEDTLAQIKFWEMLNQVMKKNGVPNVIFNGFMADEAMANWNAIRQVYGQGQSIPLVGRERSCLFHFKDSLQKHTKQSIVKDKRKQHIELCESWRNAMNEDDAKAKYNIIRAFWKTGAAYPTQCAALESWLAWWHERYSHWGAYMDAVRP